MINIATTPSTNARKLRWGHCQAQLDMGAPDRRDRTPCLYFACRTSLPIQTCLEGTGNAPGPICTSFTTIPKLLEEGCARRPWSLRANDQGVTVFTPRYSRSIHGREVYSISLLRICAADIRSEEVHEAYGAIPQLSDVLVAFTQALVQLMESSGTYYQRCPPADVDFPIVSTILHPSYGYRS
ncbi:hypothetical protein C8F04DRAFT_1255987 [Mycena alexandri]|uniref:Uncharacterized protein n=1 Tax=Mycena alexandri TaxID=1745969 RepID=A0AAD6X474_9AGAR|nr:hypothetical protein C8F04DRAFT_1255987 [Mycena alexandri]